MTTTTGAPHAIVAATADPELKAIGEKLPASKFMRVHRSYIVALNKIDFIEEGVINVGKNAIPVADAYRGSLNQQLNLL